MRFAAAAVLLIALTACGDASERPEAQQAPTPEAATAERDAAEPEYVAFDVEPRLSNADAVRELLERKYPAELRNRGIGGKVVVWLRVDESGQVGETRVQQSSEHPTLDEAALEVADSMQFTPAQNGGEPVAVWVAQTIEFKVGR
jgi:periplasmic protein TonB